MKIAKLSIENLMRISAVEINPDGNLVVISGRNGQGKTSILEAIAFALGGKKLIKEKPIKKGEDYAQVTVDLEDYIVTRRWTSDKNTTLKIESKDGASFKSPQAMLDKIIGELSFDPLGFMRMDQKEQRNVLLGLVNLGIDLDELAQSKKELYDQRTLINRQLRDKKGELSGMPEPDTEIPEAEISVAELTAELQRAIAQNNTNRENREKVTKIDGEIKNLTDDLTCLQDDLKRLSETIARKTELIEQRKKEKYRARMEVLGLADIDIGTIQAKIAGADETNKKMREIKALSDKRETIETEISKLETEANELTEKMSDLDARKEKALEKTPFPVEGLAVDESGVFWNGVPISQTSGAEQLKISMAIAMAMNPKLRVIRITDGSLLDTGNMAVIEEMAKDRDFQIWIERVDDSGKVGIVIEDGMVKTEIPGTDRPPWADNDGQTENPSREQKQNISPSVDTANRLELVNDLKEKWGKSNQFIHDAIIRHTSKQGVKVVDPFFPENYQTAELEKIRESMKELKVYEH